MELSGLVLTERVLSRWGILPQADIAIPTIEILLSTM